MKMRIIVSAVVGVSFVVANSANAVLIVADGFDLLQTIPQTQAMNQNERCTDEPKVPDHERRKRAG